MGPLFGLSPGTIVSNALSNSIPGQYMAISGHVFTNDCIVSGHVGAFVFQCSSLGFLPLFELPVCPVDNDDADGGSTGARLPCR